MADDLHHLAISGMLASPTEETAILIGGERVICGPGELRQVAQRIERMLSDSADRGVACRVALLSDDEDERRMIAVALKEKATSLGFASHLADSGWGLWAKTARNADKSVPSIHILAKVPPDSKAQEGFSHISEGLILAWPLALAGAALLPTGIDEQIVPPFAERSLDKAAHIISSAAERLRALESTENEPLTEWSLLRIVDAAALLAICVDPNRLVNVAAARTAGARLADMVMSSAALRPDESIGGADLQRGLFPREERLPANLRRLWVEGETDVILLELAARLIDGTLDGPPRILENIKIEPLGGAVQVEDALRRCDRDPTLELFMFDMDVEGQRGSQKVADRGFPTLLLQREAVMSACDKEWVIEDLISVELLDRFYVSNPTLLPKREEIEHDPDVGRRLLVRGTDKGALALWLESNATVEDVFGLIRMLLFVRRRFALREPSVEPNIPTMARIGLRPPAVVVRRFQVRNWLMSDWRRLRSRRLSLWPSADRLMKS